jgi:predicted permease
MHRVNESVEGRRIPWLERPGDDFPYYNRQPVEMTGMQWTLVMIATAVGFLVLVFGLSIFRGVAAGFIPVVCYVALPLVTLALSTHGHWTGLFRKVRGRDVLLMFLFMLLNLVVTFGVGFVMTRLIETTRNAAVSGLASQSLADIVLFYLRAVAQLFGEELMTILPFLALMHLFAARMKTGRVTAIVLAWLLTGVLFLPSSTCIPMAGA